MSTSTMVRVLFEPPPRQHAPNGPTLHARHFEDVPVALANRMAEDFRRYRDERIDRSPLYRYHRNGEEVLLSLDFEEVVGLVTAPASDEASFQTSHNPVGRS